jgi:hypothetical protein
MAYQSSFVRRRTNTGRETRAYPAGGSPYGRVERVGEYMGGSVSFKSFKP